MDLTDYQNKDVFRNKIMSQSLGTESLEEKGGEENKGSTSLCSLFLNNVISN
jgi:hypothetical protein